MGNNIKPMEDEPKVQFRLMSDRDVLEIRNEDIDQPLAQISGYDLQFTFNMEFIKSLEDVEAAVNGLGDLWRKFILKQLLSDKNEQKE